jgi:2-C-methyl-D-erythritol 4-phosphate cytidylyltransferase
MTAAIILAAGRGERMGGNVDKAFIGLGPRPIVAYSLLAFEACPVVETIVLVVRGERIDSSRELCRELGISKLFAVVGGGGRRQDSVQAGLAALPPEASIVAIHDSARPLVTPELIAATMESAQATGSGIAARKVVDTVKVVTDGNVAETTLDRSNLWAVETPQTFQTDLIRRAYDAVGKAGQTVTDDAGAVEFIGEKTRLVEWRKPNLKVTVPEDLAVAEKLLRT